MAMLYTPKQVTDMLGISASALRIYTDRYARHLSTEATSTPRKFTEADLHTLAYVVASTKEGRTHDQVLASWADEFDSFEWEPPETPTGNAGDTSTPLVPIAQLQATQALMLDAQRREEEARAQLQQRERELQERINQLERELGKAEGKIGALETQKPKPWWARVFGSE